MKRPTSAALVLLAWAMLLVPARAGLAQASGDFDAAWRKPLFSRNQFPIFLLFLGFEPERAASLRAGQTSFNFDLGLSSIIKESSLVTDDPTAEGLVLDYEWWRFVAQFEMGLGQGFQWSVSLPIYYRSGGFMDPFISSFHESFGIPNSVRLRTPDYLFRYKLYIDDHLALGPLRRGAVLGDTVLSLKKVWHFSGTEFGLRAAIKAPTGPWAEAAGSGAWDLGFGLILSSYGRALGYTLNANYCLLGAPRVEGLKARDYFSFMAGLDLRLSRSLALLVQADYLDRFVTSPIPILNRRTGQLAVGLRGRLSDRSALEFRLTEDLGSPSPDFTLGLRLEFLGRGPGRGPGS